MNITSERTGRSTAAAGSYQNQVIVSNPGDVTYGNNKSTYYNPNVNALYPTNTLSGTGPTTSRGSDRTGKKLDVDAISVVSGLAEAGLGYKVLRSGRFAEAGGEVLQENLDALGSRVLGDTAMEVGEVGEVGESAGLLEGGLAAAGEGLLGAAEVGAASVASIGLAPVLGVAAAAVAVGAGVYEVGKNISWGGENVWEHADDVLHSVESFFPVIHSSWFS